MQNENNKTCQQIDQDGNGKTGKAEGNESKFSFQETCVYSMYEFEENGRINTYAGEPIIDWIYTQRFLSRKTDEIS